MASGMYAQTVQKVRPTKSYSKEVQVSMVTTTRTVAPYPESFWMGYETKIIVNSNDFEQKDDQGHYYRLTIASEDLSPAKISERIKAMDHIEEVVSETFNKKSVSYELRFKKGVFKQYPNYFIHKLNCSVANVDGKDRPAESALDKFLSAQQKK